MEQKNIYTIYEGYMDELRKKVKKIQKSAYFGIFVCFTAAHRTYNIPNFNHLTVL